MKRGVGKLWRERESERERERGSGRWGVRIGREDKRQGGRGRKCKEEGMNDVNLQIIVI